eukprot:GHVU01123774.1.p1 GENE.GHVU01123774.1~~GHVU01123774.1.p1  ORF type:complete len:388 (+),score=46.04 GHVU01123774.1:173-1336(+)
MGVPPFSRKLVCAVLIGIPLLLCLSAEGITAEERKNESFAAVVPGYPGLDIVGGYPNKQIAIELGYSKERRRLPMNKKGKAQMSEDYIDSNTITDQMALSKYQKELLDKPNEGPFQEYSKGNTKLGIEKSWVHRDSNLGSILIHKLSGSRKLPLKKDAFFIYVVMKMEAHTQEQKFLEYVEDIAARIMQVATEHNEEVTEEKDRIKVLWVPLFGHGYPDYTKSGETIEDPDKDYEQFRSELVKRIFKGLGTGASDKSPKVEFPCDFAKTLSQLKQEKNTFKFSTSSEDCPIEAANYRHGFILRKYCFITIHYLLEDGTPTTDKIDRGEKVKGKELVTYITEKVKGISWMYMQLWINPSNNQWKILQHFNAVDLESFDVLTFSEHVSD